MSAFPDIVCAGDDLSEENIYRWLLALRAHSYAPFSGYKVSSVIKARLEKAHYYFAGVNCENSEQSLSTHGEDGAVAAMVTALGRCAVIEQAWVMGALEHLLPDSDDPLVSDHSMCCGRCRQRMAGFSDENTIIHSISLKGNVESREIVNILPRSFSFKDISPDIAADMACDVSRAAPNIAQVQENLLRQGQQTPEDIKAWLSGLEAVSYASGVQQKAVLQLANGAYVAGVRVEDAAYTGINAVQAAMAIACAAFGVFEVKALFSLSEGKEDKMPPDAFQLVSLAALQSVSEFSPQDMPVTLFSKKGAVWTMTKEEAVRQSVNSRAPYIKA